MVDIGKEIEELISVIVPVYNVKEYLDECMKSLISQTYPEIEIILIDDGSTDGSGEICDRYVLEYPQVSVYHKANGGLSDARNYGLRKARGNWIGFVDSDDKIDCRMYEILYKLCRKYHTKIACARFDEFSDDIKEKTLYKPTHISQKITGENMMQIILNPTEAEFATISVWDRLYHRTIIESMEFPKGKCYEDIVYSAKAILRAGECVYINEALYHYRLRPGSLTSNERTNGFDIRIISDRIPLQKEQVKYFEETGHLQLSRLAKARYYQEMLYIKRVNKSSKYKNQIDNALNDWKLKPREILSLNLPLKRQLILLMKMYFPLLTMLFYKTWGCRSDKRYSHHDDGDCERYRV